MNEDSGLQNSKIDPQDGLTGAGDAPRGGQSGEPLGGGNENTHSRLTRLLSGETGRGQSTGNSA